jgi:hypothetical protein
MNSLSYRCTDENGQSFELLVDGEPLGALVGARDNSIPYWIIIEGDLPHCPPRGVEPDPEVRIVTVCSCGEYGCGHTRCRVVSDIECVTFSEFDLDVSREGRAMVFRFTRTNYDAVVSGIARLAREFTANSHR